MRNIDEDNITQAVIARHAAAGNARAREVMTSLVQHLHAFAREVKLSEAEWAGGIEFLTECGRICSERRQEFGLLSDTLGLSMLVTALNQRKPEGCTEATGFVPCHLDAAPRRANGDDIANGATGEPFFVRGRVRAPDGTTVAGTPPELDAGKVENTRNPMNTARAPSSRATPTAPSTSALSSPRPIRSRTTGRWAACSRPWGVTHGARRICAS